MDGEDGNVKSKGSSSINFLLRFPQPGIAWTAVVLLSFIQWVGLSKPS